MSSESSKNIAMLQSQFSDFATDEKKKKTSSSQWTIQSLNSYKI